MRPRVEGDLPELHWGVGSQAKGDEMKAPPALESGSGIILFVERFQDCIHFYKTKIGLPVLMEKPGIVQFELGSMYLQVEDAESFGRKPTQNLIIRKNVPSISGIGIELRGRGIDLEVHDLEWGEIGFVYDPGGNKLEYFRAK